MINSLRLHYPLPLLCRVLAVSASGYHAWRNRPPSRRAREEARLEIEIKAAHCRTRETYGPERLREDLAAHGVHVTYIPTKEGWLYLACHKDLYTREIVDYAMAPRMTKHLVSQSLFRAVAAKRPAAGLLHHPDRGSQYCAHAFRTLLKQFRMQASVSRKGNCYDNTSMESFWGTLKTEHVFHRQYETSRQAMREIAEYIEPFYNRQRRQKQLGYLAPIAFERRHYEQRLAA